MESKTRYNIMRLIEEFIDGDLYPPTTIKVDGYAVKLEVGGGKCAMSLTDKDNKVLLKVTRTTSLDAVLEFRGRFTSLDLREEYIPEDDDLIGYLNRDKEMNNNG